MAEARARYPDFDVTRSRELPHASQPEADESLEAYLSRIGFTEGQLTADLNSLGDYNTATPPFFWVGEATVKNAWAATVHDALESGQRAAAEVQQYLLHPIL